MKTCTKCGKTKDESEFYCRSRNNELLAECKECFRGRMAHRHQDHKEQLVAEAGGKCERCGYDTSPRILHFHHRDPSTKLFEISDRLSANLSVLREEVKKCMLLCPNCHGEKHQGLW